MSTLGAGLLRGFPKTVYEPNRTAPRVKKTKNPNTGEQEMVRIVHLDMLPEGEYDTACTL